MSLCFTKGVVHKKGCCVEQTAVSLRSLSPKPLWHLTCFLSSHQQNVLYVPKAPCVPRVFRSSARADPCWVAPRTRMLLKIEPGVAHLHAHSEVPGSACSGWTPLGSAGPSEQRVVVWIFWNGCVRLHAFTPWSELADLPDWISRKQPVFFIVALISFLKLLLNCC